jgi:hypothetical protein
MEAPTRTATAASDLIEAARGLSQVMMQGRNSYTEAADAIDRQDYSGQPYPVTMVVMSNHVAALLRALAAVEELKAQGANTLERDMAREMGQKPTYGPRRREVE